MLPFTREQFIAIFVDYNAAIGPARIVACLAGLALIAMLVRPSRTHDRLIGTGLAAMWIWTGIAYHGLFFARINPAALLFSALFVLQGALLFQAAACHGRLRFASVGGASRTVGWALVVYAAVLYPLLGAWAGQQLREMPAFGVSPCPVTLFTFGFLLLTSTPVPRSVLVIPLVWSLIGGSAALLLDMPQDWPLLVSGVAVALLVSRDRLRLRGTLAS